MKRIRRLVDDFVGATGIYGCDITELSPLLNEMIVDYGFEERLRTLNLLNIWGIELNDSQITMLLAGENNKEVVNDS